jgi:glucuronate isomerase
MAGEFLTEDFLLQTRTARALYHEHAARMPIYDYHCHLPVHQIAADHQFETLTQAWLAGDHYKWRAMRTNGVPERYVTGDASDWEKFEKWAATVPYCLGNPLYHWTHLELWKPFGIHGQRLDPSTAKDIYRRCSDMLRSSEFSVRNIMRKMNVKLVCTTDGPLDSLEHHQRIKSERFDVQVHPAWRPDAAMAVEDLQKLNVFVDKLEERCDMEIRSFHDYIEALHERHTYFHKNGCRLSDHGLDTMVADDYTEAEVAAMFHKIRAGDPLTGEEAGKFKSAMLFEFALMDADAGWVQQFHIGALRNNCTRLDRQIGPDIGCDSIGDLAVAEPLSKFLDRLDARGDLAKTILYNLNPRDNAVYATMIGNFQDGSAPGKMQHGSGWWFLDQKDGMEDQMRTLANMGLLSRFVGMLTDSRSFLSYPRHEYFRRVLCNMLGSDVEAGLLPHDMGLLGRMVEDICYNNARNYFPMECE